MVGDTILIKDISINGNNSVTGGLNTSTADKLSETLTGNTINALGIDASSRTIWINGQPYGNAYVNIKNNTVEAPIGAEIFNDFEHNIASGDYSHASGFYTKTTNTAEAAFGQFNQSTEGSTIFSIGDGDSDSSRHNIVEVTDNNVNINNNLNVEDNLIVDENATIEGTLGVTGKTTVSALESTGNVDLESLDVTHNTTIGGTLGVTGKTTVSTLESTGNVDLESLDVTHNTTIGGTLGVTDNTTIGGTLGVTGKTTVSELKSTGNADLNSLGVTHNTTIGGTLNVTGKTTVTELKSTGNIVGENNLRIIGETSLENKVAAGKGALVTNDSEIAVGRFNKSTKTSNNYGDKGNTAFSIGIGESNDVRKNAVEVMQNGSIYINGIGGYTGENPSDSKDLATYLPNMINITYMDLRALRDSDQLVPGQQYRITNYKCTTSAAGTKSAGHQFDIIVTADSESVLNEEARAIQHDFPDDTPADVKNYFANSDLNAWKIWYCLDNDSDRFSWADTFTTPDGKPDGKGVIYRMIDEFGNDCPYDFKNIQFKHPKGTNTYQHYYFTFASGNEAMNTDCSLDILNKCYSNTIKEYIITSANSYTGSSITKISLNYIIFIGSNCYSNIFGCNCSSNSFGSNCHDNSFGSNCHNNSFGSNCYDNSFGSSCSDNSFGNYCQNNTFGSSCSDNSFGYNCHSNSFGSSCSDNVFGSFCSGNSVGNNCKYIKFASDTDNTTKYNYYYYNHFGDGCKYILFKRKNNDTTSNIIQNYNFAQGLQGTSAIYLSIIGATNRPYDTYISKSSGTGDTNVYGYCLADIAKSLTKSLTTVEKFVQ